MGASDRACKNSSTRNFLKLAGSLVLIKNPAASGRGIEADLLPNPRFGLQALELRRRAAGNMSPTRFNRAESDCSGIDWSGTIIGSGIDLRRFMAVFVREYQNDGASGESEQSPIQQMFRVSDSKSLLYYIPDNNHYLEYVIVRRNEQSG